MTTEEVRPGQRVRIQQTIRRRDGDWRCELVGVVEAVQMEPTGSWYAHAKNDRYWLRRVRLRKDDGEVTIIALDPKSICEPVAG